MKKQFKTLVAFCACVVLVAACKRKECKNTDAAFDKLLPGTEEYRRALAQKIKTSGAQNLNYYLEDYKEVTGKRYLQVKIQGDSLCAKIMMEVKNWSGIENIKATEGKGYHGAELKGLSFDVTTDSLGTSFIYRSVDKVVD